MSGKAAIEFDDRVSKRLMALGQKAPRLADEVIYSIMQKAKESVLRNMDKTFTERTGEMKKGVIYGKRKDGSFKLSAPPLASVYEHNGADVIARGKALRFEIEGSVFFRKAVRIEPRPFFYSGLKGVLSSAAINAVAEKEIERVLKESGLKV